MDVRKEIVSLTKLFFAFQNHKHDVAFDVSKIRYCNRFHNGARLLPIFCQYAVQGQRDKSCILFKGKIATLRHINYNCLEKFHGIRDSLLHFKTVIIQI